jgi:hypothetical protein
MTIHDIANRLVALCREGKIIEVQQELYSADIESIEPENAMLQYAKGTDAVVKKGIAFSETIEAVHGGSISEPLVAGNYFSIVWASDLTFKGGQRMMIEEICVYQVKDEKIIKEQFFY